MTMGPVTGADLISPIDGAATQKLRAPPYCSPVQLRLCNDSEDPL